MEKKEIQDFTQELAKALGDGWTYVVPDIEGGFWGTIVHEKEEMKINLHRGRAPGRLEVFGTHNTKPKNYDEWRQVGCRVDHITVSASRKIEHVAKDVQRRIIPALRDAIAKGKKEIEDNRRTADRQQAAVNRLMANAPEGTLVASRRDSRELDIRTPKGWGDVRVDHDGSTAAINIHNLPMEKVIKIVRILTGAEN